MRPGVCGLPAEEFAGLLARGRRVDPDEPGEKAEMLRGVVRADRVDWNVQVTADRAGDLADGDAFVCDGVQG